MTAGSHRHAAGAALVAVLAVASAAPTAAASRSGAARGHRRSPAPLPRPAALTPFSLTPGAAKRWHPFGRSVAGHAAVYETSLTPPGGGTPAGIAWMDTNLLSARLYSGSESPGGGPYRFTAPVRPAQARSLVAAFNGGFKMGAAGGGYYTEGRVVDPLRAGAASLVIYANGKVALGAWGSGLQMTSKVIAVRQNLVLLVSGGRPTPLASTPSWWVWGATCGATTCSGPGIEDQWRSGLGITADGALVYVAGPALAPLQLARLLARAGAVRAMELDINPDWPDFVTYRPASPSGLAAPDNGTKLDASMIQGAATFFESFWARDFITMSAR